jgi:hypothetical protein
MRLNGWVPRRRRGCASAFFLSLSFPSAVLLVAGLFYQIAWRARPVLGYCPAESTTPLPRISPAIRSPIWTAGNAVCVWTGVTRCR